MRFTTLFIAVGAIVACMPTSEPTSSSKVIDEVPDLSGLDCQDTNDPEHRSFLYGEDGNSPPEVVIKGLTPDPKGRLQICSLPKNHPDAYKGAIVVGFDNSGRIAALAD